MCRLAGDRSTWWWCVGNCGTQNGCYTPDEDCRNLHLCVGFFGTTAGGGNRPLAWLEPVCLEQADNDCRISDPSVTEGDDGTLYVSCSYRVSNGDGVCEKICVIQYDGLRG